MIVVKIKLQYKSITPCEFEIPNFCVLTGLNGSGKTHLLEAISNRNISEVFLDGKKITNVIYIPFNGLNPKIEENCDPTIIVQFIKKFASDLKNALRRFPNRTNITETQVLQTSHEQSFKKAAPRIFAKINKPLHTITEEDVADHFDISMMANDDFFTGQFALIFKNYHKHREENKINRYYNDQGHAPVTVLTDTEFVTRYGVPPWEFVNSILAEINVPYIVNSPEGSRAESNFNFRLVDKFTGIEISSADLSTGEKVLMSLALAIYNTKGNMSKPEFLLIDEPDAALHPSMSRKMINVLNQNIVLESNIPAIITSHSPTTIISTEGISIFQMRRGDPVPDKISVQQAVELLSSDIPFLKISNDQRRQVFVESKYDVVYYEMLTNILLRLEPIPSDPIYIPARTSSGSNCTDVIEVVKNLFENGNDQIYGIIDWDLINITNDRTIVLGENERYSIENYLLDPLLMGLLFIREAKILISEFGLTNAVTYSEITNLNQADAQKIIDKILNELGLYSANLVSYSLQNDWELLISKEFNNIQGHSLENLYKEKYPFLNVYQREDALKKDVIQKIINDFPKLTPKSIFNTIKQIK